jgi:C1A family cysteine protease
MKPRLALGHDPLRLAGAAAAYQAAGLPASYDLRALERMTAVRDEGALGGSHAFAALASLESFLRPGEIWDFSENHLRSGLAGATSLDAVVGALARWADPVREADDPWPAAEGEAEAVKHVQNVVYLLPRTSSSDNDHIKQAVMDSGAVWADMLYDPSLLNAAQASYYSPLPQGQVRAVAVAGWDDAFDRARFSPQPPGNGAFLCKNSLGTAWGDGGYFYVSYYDAGLARESFAAAITADPRSGYTVQYAYDPNGCTARIGFEGETGWFAVQHVASSTDPLAAVGFYAFTGSGTYDISVYLDPLPGRPRSGALAAQQSGAFSVSGLMTIPLSSSVPLRLGQRFSVVVGLRTDGDEYPIPLEHPIGAAVFEAAPGQGFISPDGREWTDLTTADGVNYALTSLCLKAFAGFAPLYPPINLKIERLVNDLYFFKEYVDKLTWQPHPKNAEAPVRYRIYRRSATDEAAPFEKIGETTGPQLLYYARAVKKDDAFLYRVTAVWADGRESDPAEARI